MGIIPTGLSWRPKYSSRRGTVVEFFRTESHSAILMAEAKSALKVRWTTKEVAMLVEVWADICCAPGAKRLKGEQLNKAIFDQYNARCARTRQLRRSPTAVNTQRTRMTHFARFVSDFDRAQLSQGRRTWFQLSSEEQLDMDIPNEWRRQITIFSPELLNTFKRCILPVEDAQPGGNKRDKKRKSVCTLQQSASQPSRKQQKETTYQPVWTLQDSVCLARRWGDFMKTEGLTLEEFQQMTYGSSCEHFAVSARSAFSAWRKVRSLVSSWRFICAFDAQHQPGWFELMEAERDLLIKWGELPDNFEDIEREVFAAMQEAAPMIAVQVKEEEPYVPKEAVAPPSPKALSPISPAPLEPTPLLPPLCTKEARSESTETDATLDSLLLEEDDAEVAATQSELQPGTLVPDACISDAKLPCSATATATSRQDMVSYQPLEPKSVSATERAGQTLETILQIHESEVQSSLRQCQAALERENLRTQECIRATRLDQLTNGSFGFSKHMELVLTQQKRRVVSALRFVEETCTQNGAEMRSLVEELFGHEGDPIRNGSAGVDMVVQVSAPSRMTQF
ncbi:hypothetical protein KRP22_009337 [Phytophthora ramorum]|nr:hypothetical protein KRP22_8168 [Phytophthora ramorum]